MAERLGGADEGEAALLVLVEHVDLNAGDLLDLLGSDLAVLRGALADPGVGALLHHLAKLPLPRLGDQQTRGIRADIDGPTEHFHDSLRAAGSSGRRNPQLASSTRRTA